MGGGGACDASVFPAQDTQAKDFFKKEIEAATGASIRFHNQKRQYHIMVAGIQVIISSVENPGGIVLGCDGTTGAQGLSILASWSMAVGVVVKKG